ncbi:MFS transporter [Lichenihabitans psoromatis]|uniref:MFS transporter n=1 Tax=Lichenihabitans psoromatis TaxID=2528642 RepID=UPI0013F17C74
MTDTEMVRRSSRIGAAPVGRWQQTRSILIGSIGNLIEWYDVYAYSAFALYFAGSFFPQTDPVAQQLSAASLFAVAFLMRPVGSLLFGYFADRFGRRTSLTWSVLLMCFGSLLIAVSPTYATIGVWAPVILSLARILQGLSQGGEYGTSATYLSEMSEPQHRGFYSGVWYVTLIGGQLLALVVLLVLQKLLLTPDQLKAWGWRIPFVIGALLAVYGYYMRRDLAETELFKTAKADATRVSFWSLIAGNWRGMLLVIGITIGGTSAFYTYTTYMQKFLKLSVGLTDDQTTLVTAVSLLFAIMLQPIYGAISDRIGRKPLLVGFGVLGTLGTVPLLSALHDTKSPWVAMGLICLAWLIVSGYTSITAIVKAELFPTAIRAVGVGLPYAFTAAIFGGSVDYVALTFKKNGFETGFYWYATACIAISLVVYLFLPDTKTGSRMDRAV